MQFFDVVIYLLASFGLIFTIFSIFESYNNKQNLTYYIKDCTCKNNNKVLVKIQKIDENDVDDVIEKLKYGKYDDIYKLSDDVKIVKYN